MKADTITIFVPAEKNREYVRLDVVLKNLLGDMDISFGGLNPSSLEGWEWEGRSKTGKRIFIKPVDHWSREKGYFCKMMFKDL